jgi:hypothetical protein
LASAIELIERACHLSERLRRDHVFSAIFPIVVLPNQTLWTVKYDINGNIVGEPTLVDHCEFYVARRVRVNISEFAEHFCFSHIDFFTLSGFNSFLIEITQEDEKWQRLFTNKAQEITALGAAAAV